MKILWNDDSNKKLIMGTVAENVSEMVKDGIKKAIVKLADKNGEITTIFFSNRPEGTQMADRVLNAHIKTGSTITVLAYIDEGKNTGTGLDFKFPRSVWTFNDGKGEINILFGTICGQREISPTAVHVSMPVRIYDRETRTTEERWASIAFFDSDPESDPERKRTFAAWAKNRVFELDTVTGKYKTFFGACICGALNVKENPETGQTYYNYSGWRIELA